MCICIHIHTIPIYIYIYIYIYGKNFFYTVVQPGKMMIFGIFGIVTPIMYPGSVPDPCWPRNGHFRAISEDFKALVESKFYSGEN